MQTLKAEKTPNSVTPTSVLLDKSKPLEKGMTVYSALSTVIEGKNPSIPTPNPQTGTLARLIENVRAREQKFGYVTETELLEIANFYTINRWICTKEERDQATMLLAKYHMATLLCNRRKLADAMQKPARARCARCGLVITSKKSLETGLGSVCRKKVALPIEKPTKPEEPQPMTKAVQVWFNTKCVDVVSDEEARKIIADGNARQIAENQILITPRWW